jgi:antitoxin FitA
MTPITILLSDDQWNRLKSLADRIGVPPEDVVRAGLDEWLSRPEQDFAPAADYVLRKNAELYRRLA